MKENENDKPVSQTGPGRVSTREFNRRLTMLKAEVNLDFPTLIPSLESGTQVILVTDKDIGLDLNPDVLRRLGGMTVLCSYYGAAVVFVNPKKLTELGERGEED
jgi:hypothetical protein